MKAAISGSVCFSNRLMIVCWQWLHGYFSFALPTDPVNCCCCRYRTSVEEVPVQDYIVPLGQAEVIKQGNDITLIGWGAQVSSGV